MPNRPSGSATGDTTVATTGMTRSMGRCWHDNASGEKPYWELAPRCECIDLCIGTVQDLCDHTQVRFSGRPPVSRNESMSHPTHCAHCAPRSARLCQLRGRNECSTVTKAVSRPPARLSPVVCRPFWYLVHATHCPTVPHGSLQPSPLRVPSPTRQSRRAAAAVAGSTARCWAARA